LRRWLTSKKRWGIEVVEKKRKNREASPLGKKKGIVDEFRRERGKNPRKKTNVFSEVDAQKLET